MKDNTTMGLLEDIRDDETEKKIDTSIIDRLVGLSQYSIISQEVAITPGMAKYMLSMNPSNRKKKPVLIQEISTDIKAGRWGDKGEANGESIIISRCGMVNDGQNRLEAIARSGRTCKAVMVFGVTRDSRMSVDSHQSARTNADYLHMGGVENSSPKAVVAKAHLVGKRLRKFTPSSVSNQRFTRLDVINWAHENEDAIAVAIEITKDSRVVTMTSRTLMSVMYMLIKEASKSDKVDIFFKELITGSMIDEKSVIYLLRNRLQKERKNKAFTGDDQAEAIIRAWNHFLAGTPDLNKLQLMKNIPEIDG